MGLDKDIDGNKIDFVWTAVYTRSIHTYPCFKNTGWEGCNHRK